MTRWDDYQQALLTVMGCQLPRLEQGWSCQLLIQPTFSLPSCLTLLADTESLLQFVILCDRPHHLFSTFFSHNPPPISPTLTPEPLFETIITLNPAQTSTLYTQLVSYHPWTLENLNLIGRDGIAIRCEWQDTTPTRTHTFSTLSSNLQHPEKHFYFFQILIKLALQFFPEEPFKSYLKDL